MSGAAPLPEALRARILAARAPRAARPAAIEAVAPGEESVWDFPRPPRVEAVAVELAVEVAGRRIAATTRGLRVVETAGAPVYYFPPDDVEAARLRASATRPSLCEWKGFAQYYDVIVGDDVRADAAFSYPAPFDDLGQGYRRIAGFIAFHASRVDRATLGGAPVRPQPGGYYAGWVTPGLRGPIKGLPGSEGW